MADAGSAGGVPTRRRRRLNAEAWAARLEELRAFVAANGRLPRAREASGLGLWASNQRVAYKRGAIPAERVAALEAVPCWAWEADFDVLWLETLEELKAFVAEHGRLPTQREARALTLWVYTQRAAKKAMDAGSTSAEMTPARVAALEAVPGWAWAADLEAAWQEKLEALEAYVAEHGRLPLFRDASGLGGWIHQQRQAKKAMDAGRKSSRKMTPKRVAALEAVPGWTWEVDLKAAWQAKLEALEAYVAEHGRLPRQGDPSGLGEWIHTQRQGKKAMDAGKTGTVRNGMTPERAVALEAVPGWTWGGSRAGAARRARDPPRAAAAAAAPAALAAPPRAAPPPPAARLRPAAGARFRAAALRPLRPALLRTGFAARVL
jgi:hypothetical protein